MLFAQNINYDVLSLTHTHSFTFGFLEREIWYLRLQWKKVYFQALTPLVRFPVLQNAITVKLNGGAR
jgi:hypothetical protein